MGRQSVPSRCGLSRSIRWATLGLLSGVPLFLIPVACGRTGKAPVPAALEVKVELGIAGSWDPHGWTELRVEFDNRGGDLRGQVLVEGFPPDEPAVVYRAPLELPGSARRRLTFPVEPLGWEAVDVTVETLGFSRRYRSHLATPRGDLTGRVWILGIGERLPHLGKLCEMVRSSLDESRRRILEERRRHGRDWEDMSLVPKTCQPVFVEPRDLPAGPAAYETFHLAVLYESSLAGAAPEAVRSTGESPLTCSRELWPWQP